MCVHRKLKWRMRDDDIEFDSDINVYWQRHTDKSGHFSFTLQ